jgi:hypothetical protein
MERNGGCGWHSAKEEGGGDPARHAGLEASTTSSGGGLGWVWCRTALSDAR